MRFVFDEKFVRAPKLNATLAWGAAYGQAASIAIETANKQFELMIYPGRTHGIFGGNTRRHLFTMLTDFFREHLADPQQGRPGLGQKATAESLLCCAAL